MVGPIPEERMTSPGVSLTEISNLRALPAPWAVTGGGQSPSGEAVP